jgi:hypothetical protein
VIASTVLRSRTRRPALGPRRQWRALPALVLGSVPYLAGCYASMPVQGTPVAGATVVLDLNDRGRVVLGDQIGPSATKVEGEVASASDSLYSLRVNSVSYLNGQSNRWSGEPLSVPVNLISQTTQRSFSRGRTTLLGVATAAALAVLITSTNLIGNASGGEKGNPPPPGGSQ